MIFCVSEVAEQSLWRSIAAWIRDQKKKSTPCGTRTRNLRIRSPTPCPLGQGGHGAEARFACQERFQFVFAFDHCFGPCWRTPVRGRLASGALLSIEKSKNAIMTPVGFEPTQLALVELESTPLDHSGKVSLSWCFVRLFRASTILFASAVARSSVHAECDTQ